MFAQRAVRSVHGLLLTVAALAFTTEAFAQQRGSVPERTLGAPTRRVSRPFSSVIGLHERSDGRIVVVDARENQIVLSDPARDQHLTLGRPGGGPGEYQLLLSLVGLRGDTTLLGDAGKRVFHVVTPDGAMRTALPWPADVGLGLATPRGADTHGRIYFVGDPWKAAQVSSGGGQNVYAVKNDSIPMLRWDRAASRVDQVATLRITSPEDDEPRRVAIRSGAVPFAGRDDAAVAADGRVAIARARPFAIDMVAPDGRLRGGAPIAFTPIRVAEEDRQAIRQSRRTSRFLSTNERGGQPDLGSDPPWDEFKPPFAFGRGILMAPDGTAWVQRSTAHNDTTPKYELYDAAGSLVSVVRLAPRSRAVAFGSGGVWVAREDDDGLIWLTKHPL